MNARRAAAIRHTFALHPELLANRNRKVAEANRRPERRSRSAQVARDNALWEKGLPAMQSPEARKKQAASQSRARLSHIPIERQDDYRALVSKVGAKEAERLVLEHNAILAARAHG